MGKLTPTMTGNFLTLLAWLGTLATLALCARAAFDRPLARVRIESTVRRPRAQSDRFEA
jgi:hypothetical protein